MRVRLAFALRSRQTSPPMRPGEREGTARPPARTKPHGVRLVLPGRGVVAVAGEEELVEARADLAVRRLDERQAEVLRRVLDAVQVARDLAVAA